MTVLLGHTDDGTAPVDGLDRGLVDRDGSQRDGGRGQDPAPDTDKVAARAEVHQGITAVFEGDLDLGQLLLYVRKIAGGSEVDVDFGAEAAADPAGVAGGVAGIPGDDGEAAENEIGDFLGRKAFGLGGLSGRKRNRSFSDLLDECHDG